MIHSTRDTKLNLSKKQPFQLAAKYTGLVTSGAVNVATIKLHCLELVFLEIPNCTIRNGFHIIQSHIKDQVYRLCFYPVAILINYLSYFRVF